MSRLFAALYDRLIADMEKAGVRDWRAKLLANLSGSVLEIGAGTGLNLEHYPRGIDLVVSEPDRHMRARLQARADQLGRAVTVIDAPAERIPFPDASFDAVVSTLVLCSVADPGATLAEIRRVLVPGGRLVFLEHVADEHDPRRRRWQRRVEPVWRRVAGNCHLTRTTERALVDAGFTMQDITRESMEAASSLVRPTVRGSAVR
jgi:ubiquinone/menaquinone biosynthesis C-methylase UbiE